jgi:hypothetical protein
MYIIIAKLKFSTSATNLSNILLVVGAYYFYQIYFIIIAFLRFSTIKLGIFPVVHRLEYAIAKEGFQMAVLPIYIPITNIYNRH